MRLIITGPEYKGYVDISKHFSISFIQDPSLQYISYINKYSMLLIEIHDWLSRMFWKICPDDMIFITTPIQTSHLLEAQNGNEAEKARENEAYVI